ncbi:MAG TPA: hypothetical protein VJ672_02810 [Gemmatimonadaceae bacterium]|nr:hypothetical protein [Gemmatimonadaceae bacterium]
MTPAQTSAFEFDSARVPVGRVFHYRKSNRDGTHATRVSVYVANRTRLESLKWENGESEATLVVATMDWPRFSVRCFDAWQLIRGRPPERRASLTANPEAGIMRVSMLGDSTVPVASWPWHSYDFDFASLSAVMPHLRITERAFTFARFDVTWSGDEITGFTNYGEIRVRFVGREYRHGVAARRYSIGGSGLGGTSGHLWADVTQGHIIEFELPVPDEPGMRDVRLRLEKVVSMTADEWAAFKRRAVGESARD